MSGSGTTTRWFSLRRRLLVLLLGGVTAGWLVAVGFAYVETRHEVMDLLEKRRHYEHLEKSLKKELAEHLLTTMLKPLLFGLPLLAFWIWFAARRGLAPVDSIAAEVARRAPQHLEPLWPATAPSEIRPLLDALNALFGRVTQVLENERRFTADSAHELRTPLAAILAQAQVAQRARDNAEREHALAQIVAGSQRAGRLVEQLLVLARLDPAVGLSRQPVRLDLLAAEVCADHGATALEKNICLGLDAPETVTVAGDADMLRVLLRNLIDNALRYTPPHGKVDVGITANRLTVADSGPGIPAEHRETVLRRFHRLAGQEIEGSGLGLSIVARIAELHGAQISLDAAEETGGLMVRIVFPPPIQPSA
jgi:two-component system sensor histidine kinase QseC